MKSSQHQSSASVGYLSLCHLSAVMSARLLASDCSYISQVCPQAWLWDTRTVAGCESQPSAPWGFFRPQPQCIQRPARGIDATCLWKAECVYAATRSKIQEAAAYRLPVTASPVCDFPAFLHGLARSMLLASPRLQQQPADRQDAASLCLALGCETQLLHCEAQTSLTQRTHVQLLAAELPKLAA